MKKNFDKSRQGIIAEPLYLLLAAKCHPDAHEYVREKTLEAEKTGKTVMELAKADSDLNQFFEKIDPKQLAILNDPEKYTGIAEKKTLQVCKYWKTQFRI